MSNEYQNIELKEGLRLIFPSNFSASPHHFFTLMTFASSCLGGKPVFCRSFLPNINLSLQSQQKITNDQEQEWLIVQTYLNNWVEHALPSETGSLIFNAYQLNFTQGNTPETGVVYFERHWLPMASRIK
jgi:hypothetical protein